MTIVILFHLSGYRCFKWYCREYVCERLSGYFPRLVSCNQFVELMGYSALPLVVYTQMFRRGKATGAGFIDSPPIKVRHNRCISRHKMFKGHAERGKSSTGWFYGFKLRLTINDRRKTSSFFLSPGNVGDWNEGGAGPDVPGIMGKTLRGPGIYIAGIVRTAVPAWDKTGNPAEKKHEKQAYENGGESFVTETGGDRISKRFSEEHPPNRAQPASEFYQFYGESGRGVVSLQFLTA